MPSLTWCIYFAFLTTLNMVLDRTVPGLQYAHGDFPELLFVVPASFKLA